MSLHVYNNKSWLNNYNQLYNKGAGQNISKNGNLSLSSVLIGGIIRLILRKNKFERDFLKEKREHQFLMVLLCYLL